MQRPRVAKLAFIILSALGSLFFAAPGAIAQVDVRGQFILPDGNLPSANIRFYFTSDDGRVNEIRYSDSNGRFILERLSNRISYTISVDSDSATFGNSRYSFLPAYEQVVRMTLNQLPATKTVAKGTVSAASGYKPTPKVAALHERAMKEIKKKHENEGELLLREAIAADPKYLAPLNDLGVLLMTRKDYQEAEQVLQQAVAVDPKSVHPLLNLGITRNHLGRYQDAIAPLREVTRLSHGVVAAHLHLGMALVETDQFAEAEKELNLAARSEQADRNLVLLYRGKLYARTGDFDKSIAIFNTYLEGAPQATNAGEVHALITRMQELKATAKRH